MPPRAVCHCYTSQINGPNYQTVNDSLLLWAHWRAPVPSSSDSIFVSRLSLCRHVPHSLKTSALDEKSGYFNITILTLTVSAASREGASHLPPGHDVPSLRGPRESARPVLWSDGGRCAQTLRPAEEREVGEGSWATWGQRTACVIFGINTLLLQKHVWIRCVPALFVTDN